MRSEFFKYLTIYMILLISASDALSQLGFGLVGGIHHSSLSIDNKADNATLKPRNGIIIAVSSRYNLSSNSYLSGQIKFIEKGQDVEWRQFIWDYTEAQFQYLELPIYFNYRFPLKNVKPKIFCGAYFGYMVSAQSIIKTNDEINEYDMINEYNKVDFGIDVGAGVDFSISENYDLFLDFYYSHGLVNITKNEGTVQNRGFQITLGVIVFLSSAI